MKKLVLVTCLLSLAFAVQAQEGLINVRSADNVRETTDRLEAILKNKGMTVMNRIQHSVAASKVGIELRDTELLVFGNPKVGSPLMQCQQTVAIDLPQKALVWEDAEGAVWISYNDPAYLRTRHNINGCQAVLEKVSKALSGMINAAAGN